MDQPGELRARSRVATTRNVQAALAIMLMLSGCNHGATPPTRPSEADEELAETQTPPAKQVSPSGTPTENERSPYAVAMPNADAPSTEAPRDKMTREKMAAPAQSSAAEALGGLVRSDDIRVEGLGLRSTGAAKHKGDARGMIGQGRGGGSRMPMRRAMQPSSAAANIAAQAPEFNTEGYAHNADNLCQKVKDSPLSTFSVDVDTASYSNVRRFLRDGQRPPIDAVRIEELVNYFRYDYAQPEGDEPFAVATEVASAPWNPQHRLVRIGLRARDIAQADVPARNLVFLVDVSGSMQSPDKLPLLKRGLSMLVRQLRPKDRIAIAVYAGASGLALPSTPGSAQQAALDAIDALEAGGSTNGADGIELAYRIAQQQFVKGGVNRVVLATDGDFNVGVTSQGDLVRLIEEKRKGGVFLTVLGFGTGNLKDSTMEMLADKGNGHYAYIDSVEEARKVLVREAGSTLVTVAKDVKLQIEWNPTRVATYRLIGYENRVLADRDFNDDTKDAGEIGAGHTVTALYEVELAEGGKQSAPAVDPLKYQSDRTLTAASDAPELLTVKLRYKRPTGDASQLLSRTVLDAGKRIEQASVDLRWAAAVAGFGMVLRQSEQRGSASFALVRELASSAIGSDPHGDRRELLMLVDRAAQLHIDG